MKLYLPLSCVLLVAVQSLAHNLQSEFGPSTKNTLLDDVDVADEGTDDSNRIRRSGLTGLINKKLHFIGHLSGSSSGSSSHSSSHDDHHHGHHDEHHLYGTEHHEYGLPHFEHHDEGKAHKVWDFKKHILASLLQAVKAITGGVVALKGQVMKIGGHLITWKGKFLVKKGDQISDFGREFASKALLTPVHHTHHSSVVYSPPSSFGSSAYASAQASHSSGHASEIYHHHHGGHHYAAPAYSAPAPTYTAPSGGASYPYPPSSVSEYEFGGSYGNKVTRAASSPSTQSQGNSQNAISNDQLHAGLLILKPIQVPKDQQSKYQFAKQSLLQQSGINVNTVGNSGNLNLNSANYNSFSAPSQSNGYQSSPSSYSGPSSYGTASPATSPFVKIPSSNNYIDYRNSFAPTPLAEKLPTESSPFDFLYQKNKQTSQERFDTSSGNSDNIRGNALNALNVLYQQTEAQNKEQNRDTRNAADEPLNDETLKKILDALFDKKSTGGFSSQEKSDMDSSASENVDTLVNKDLSSVVKRSDVVYPVFEVDYQT